MESNHILDQYAEKMQSSHPPPRFGHTTNIISRNSIVLFGGAVNYHENPDSYIMTSDLYLFDIYQNIWRKIDSDNHPKSRAMHASATAKDNLVFYFGGLTNKGLFANDGLWSLEIKNNDKPEWTQISTIGPTPQPRYGHAMEYMHNKLFLYGGSSNSDNKKKIMNDIWIFPLFTTNKWIKVNIEEDNSLIIARVYHTFCAYTKINRDNDIIILFGGRDSHNKSLKDLFSLTRIGNNNDYFWEIQNQRNKEDAPISRYEHSATMLGPFLFIMGGKSSESNNNTTFDVFSFISSSWYNFGKCNLFRHTTWIFINDSNPDDIKLYLYIYGGFDGQYNNELNKNLFRIDIFNLFSKKDDLKKQLNDYLLILKNNKIINWNKNIDCFFSHYNDFDINNDNTRNNNRRNNNISIDTSSSESDSEKDNKIIDMLEEKKITKDIIKNAEVKRCSICLEDYFIGKDISYLPCCHHFHSRCIKKWLLNSKKCPLCKNDVKIQDLKSSYHKKY